MLTKKFFIIALVGALVFSGSAISWAFWSKQETFTPQIVAPIVPTPTNVTCVNSANDTVTVSWGTVSVATKYEIWISNNDGSNLNKLTEVNAPGTSIILTRSWLLEELLTFLLDILLGNHPLKVTIVAVDENNWKSSPSSAATISQKLAIVVPVGLKCN